jgi:hypothetical protein
MCNVYGIPTSFFLALNHWQYSQLYKCVLYNMSWINKFLLLLSYYYIIRTGATGTELPPEEHQKCLILQNYEAGAALHFSNLLEIGFLKFFFKKQRL